MSNILLTRPYNDNYPLAEQLRDKGHHVLLEPMFEVEYKPFSLEVNATAVIFTSKNALKAIGDKVDSLMHCECYVVGDATARLAKEYGFKDIYVADNNAYSLLDLVRDNADRKFDRLVYFCGEITSLDLTSILSENGYQIEEIQVYKTIAKFDFSAEIKKKLVAREIHIVLLYSYHTAEIFLDLIERSNMQSFLTDIDLYIISSKLSVLVDKYKWKSVKLIGSDFIL